MTRRVLITGARAAAALDLARDFAATGWIVHCADSVRSRLARWSSLAAKHHSYPAPRHNGEAFRERILQLVDEHRINLIVPTCEEVFHLAAPSLRQTLGERLYSPDLAMLRTLHDKLAFANALREWGLIVPESHPITDQKALEDFTGTSSEWVFKPRFGRFGNSTMIAPDTQRLAQIKPSDENLWMAQRLILGEEVCLHGIAYHGKLVAFAAYRSNWRLSGGAAYAFRPLDKAEAESLHPIAKCLAQSARIHGQFGCDVIIDGNGQAHLIECNPRATSGVHLLTGDGHLARAISEGMTLPEKQATDAYLGPAMLGFGLPQAIASGKLALWRSTMKFGRDVIAQPGDRLPFMGAMADSIAFAAKGFKHSITTSAATTYDIEWNGEELEQ